MVYPPGRRSGRVRSYPSFGPSNSQIAKAISICFLIYHIAIYGSRLAMYLLN